MAKARRWMLDPRFVPEMDELTEVVEVNEHRAELAAWLLTSEAFEIAWRGARRCGTGKISAAQLTAALNALAAATVTDRPAQDSP